VVWLVSEPVGWVSVYIVNSLEAGVIFCIIDLYRAPFYSVEKKVVFERLFFK